MELTALRRVPGSDIALEDQAIAGVEKHLRRAARGAGIGTRMVTLENEPDVADALANSGDLPRPTARLVKGRGRQSPCDLRRLLREACRKSGWQHLARRDRALTDDLRRHLVGEETRFQLIVEVGLVLVRHGGGIVLGKERRLLG